MKKHIVIALFVLISVSCTRKQRDDSIVLYCNYSVPETLIIESACPFLTDAQFNKTSFDTAKMQKIEEQTTQQVLNIMDEAWNAHFQREANNVNKEACMESIMPPINVDTIYQKVFACGRINLHSDITSMVVFRIDSIDYYTEKGYYLCNLKGNKLQSIVELSTSFYMSDADILEGTTYHNGLFTYFNGTRIFSPSDEGYSLIKSLIYKSFIPYARYKIDEDGFVQTLND